MFTLKICVRVFRGSIETSILKLRILIDKFYYGAIGNQAHCSYSSSLYYAPNFGDVEGAYWFGPVHPSVCLSVTLGS